MQNNLKRITAILGPTNTGKTHLAVETMLSFESGILGFPLRLLAREVYDKILQKSIKKLENRIQALRDESNAFMTLQDNQKELNEKEIKELSKSQENITEKAPKTPSKKIQKT